jgi:hypothetical protein
VGHHLKRPFDNRFVASQNPDHHKPKVL